MMKLVKVSRGGEVAEGFLEGGTVYVSGGWHAGLAADVPFMLSRRDDLVAARAAATGVPLASVTLEVPIDPRAKLICVGINYRDHAAEVAADAAQSPMIFTRFHDSIVAHGQPIVRPKGSDHFDFEGEIAIVIGKAARHVALADALAYVSGYSCFMDGSIRDYQKHSVTAGKNFWRTGAMGPWIVPAADFTPGDPALTTRLNGIEVQSSHASLMIFGISQIIEYCSRWTELRPGDVIATGTPGGVGSRRVPPLWMKPGDRVEVEVEGIGTLGNTVIDAPERVAAALAA